MYGYDEFNSKHKEKQAAGVPQGAAGVRQGDKAEKEGETKSTNTAPQPARYRFPWLKVDLYVMVIGELMHQQPRPTIKVNNNTALDLYSSFIHRVMFCAISAGIATLRTIGHAYE